MHDALFRFQKELRATFAGCLKLPGAGIEKRRVPPAARLDRGGGVHAAQAIRCGGRQFLVRSSSMGRRFHVWVTAGLGLPAVWACSNDGEIDASANIHGAIGNECSGRGGCEPRPAAPMSEPASSCCSQQAPARRTGLTPVAAPTSSRVPPARPRLTRPAARARLASWATVAPSRRDVEEALP